MSFEDRINTIIVKGAFEQLLAAGWTPSTFAEAWHDYHETATKQQPLVPASAPPAN